MPIHVHSLPVSDPSLPATASWLLDRRPGSRPEDLAEALVLVPATRVADGLRHALLEAAGADALLLPAIFTGAHLAGWLAQQGGFDESDLPAPPLRHLMLAPPLAQTVWLGDRPESAPGLAAELIELFDEVRLAGRDALVLEGCDETRLLRTVAAEGAEALQRDLAHVREAWRIYREIVPRDEIDERLTALTAAQQTWPGELPSLLAVVHPGRLDRATADLVVSLGDRGVPVHLLVFGADDDRSRLLLATYRDRADRPAHPLDPVRKLVARLGAELPDSGDSADEDLVGRLEGLNAARDELKGDGPVRLYSCRDPEHESRVVATVVGDALEAATDGVPEIIVATQDQELAARITAQLRDTGIDVDDTRGRPLVTLPAGRLVRDLLRTVHAGWPFGPVFEVLSHPYVRLTLESEQPGHAVRVRLLETAVRRAAIARGGLEALRAAATLADEREKKRREVAALPWTLAEFVTRLVDGLAPLGAVTGTTVAWSELLGAVRRVWTTLAPDRPFGEGADPRLEIDDTEALDRLLDALEKLADGGGLPDAPPGEIASAVRRLLADPLVAVARPHRRPYLPVRVMGLVEARLESADLVVLAGLGQDVFPGRPPRPAFLGDGVRRALDLEHRRGRAGRDAELFLRLLHAAPRVVVTWPEERRGEPTLPSPLVQRLLLVKPPGTDTSPPKDKLRRRLEPDWDALVNAEMAFRTETPAMVAATVALPDHLSHAALTDHRACPYRFLLGRGLGLRRAEPVEAQYTRLDHGRLAHVVMEKFLAPGGPGVSALAAGDVASSAGELQDLAAEVFAGGLPEHRLWREAFLQLVPEIVAVEIERATHWRTVAVERRFRLPLGELAAWARACGPEVEVPDVPDSWASFPLVGSIDRVDASRDGDGRTAVVDFKTGVLPTSREVADGTELQVVLYAAAVDRDALEDPPAGADTWRVEHGGYYALRRGQVGLPRQPQLVLDETGRPAAARGAGALVAEALRCLDREEPFPLVQTDALTRGRGLPCGHCDFRAVCRLEERPLDSELATLLTSLLTGDWRRGGR